MVHPIHDPNAKSVAHSVLPSKTSLQRMTQSPHPFWVRGLPSCKCASSRERNANLWRRRSGGPVGAGRGQADRCREPPRRGPPRGATCRYRVEAGSGRGRRGTGIRGRAVEHDSNSSARAASLTLVHGVRLHSAARPAPGGGVLLVIRAAGGSEP